MEFLLDTEEGLKLVKDGDGRLRQGTAAVRSQARVLTSTPRTPRQRERRRSTVATAQRKRKHAEQKKPDWQKKLDLRKKRGRGRRKHAEQKKLDWHRKQESQGRRR